MEASNLVNIFLIWPGIACFMMLARGLLTWYGIIEKWYETDRSYNHTPKPWSPAWRTHMYEKVEDVFVWLPFTVTTLLYSYTMRILVCSWRGHRYERRVAFLLLSQWDQCGVCHKCRLPLSETEVQ